MRSRLYFLVEAELRQRGIAIPYPHLDLALRNPEVLRPDWHPNEGRPARPALAEQLRQLSYFADYTDWQLREMVEIGYRLNLKAGEVLLAEGDRISNFYIVLSGRLNIFNSQVSRCIETIGPGEYCGEVGLILNIARSFVTFQAGAETTLFVVPQQHACHFLRSHTRLQEAVNRTLTSRQEKVQDLREQLEVAGLLPPESETGNFVVWLQRQFQRFINREAA